MSLRRFIGDLFGSFLGGVSSTPPEGESTARRRASPYGRGRPFVYDPHTGEGTPPPQVPGEYRIMPRRGSPLKEKYKYIGETSNLAKRMADHLRAGKIVPGEVFVYKWAEEGSTSVTRREHERRKIDQHDPPGNKRAGGGGRRASR